MIEQARLKVTLMIQFHVKVLHEVLVRVTHMMPVLSTKPQLPLDFLVPSTCIQLLFSTWSHKLVDLPYCMVGNQHGRLTGLYTSWNFMDEVVLFQAQVWSTCNRPRINFKSVKCATEMVRFIWHIIWCVYYWVVRCNAPVCDWKALLLWYCQ